MGWLERLKDLVLRLFGGSGATTEIPIEEVTVGLDINPDGTISVTIGCETVTAPLETFIAQDAMARCGLLVSNLRVAALMDTLNPDDPKALQATAAKRVLKVVP